MRFEIYCTLQSLDSSHRLICKAASCNDRERLVEMSDNCDGAPIQSVNLPKIAISFDLEQGSQSQKCHSKGYKMSLLLKDCELE
jgi:hypothetical protein